MFWLYLVTSILEILMLMPEAYIALQFATTPLLAFLLCLTLAAVVLPAGFICRLKPGPFVYKALTVVLSVLIAIITAGLNVGGLLMAAACIFIFTRVRSEMNTGRDVAVQFASAAIVANIPIGLLLYFSELQVIPLFGNIALVISTVSAIIILVIKQVDQSRRFGKNTMGVSSTQRKNNQVFAGIILTILLVAGSFGQVSTIYAGIIRMISKVFGIIAGLFSFNDKPLSSPGSHKQDQFNFMVKEDPSQFEKIVMLILQLLGTLLFIAILLFIIYKVIRFIINSIIKIVRWFKSGEHIIDRVSEDGHTDEKESLLDRNLKNAAHRFRGMAAGLLNREVPYDRLPDDIAKVRRLLKNFIKKARHNGIAVSNASTAQELCRDAGGIAPAQPQLNALLADCYDKARYDGTAPQPDQLRQLEQHLFKK